MKILNRMYKIYRKKHLYPILNPLARRFECPVCNYKGPFRSINASTGFRKYALCPNCNAAERHRLQCWCLQQLFKKHDFKRMRFLHFAPEAHLQQIIKSQVGKYETADLFIDDVDYQVDIQSLPFRDGSYDFVFASHVLEHVRDDCRALSEIRRILVPGGIAILPVPIIAFKTVEYPEPNPYESDHVRASGYDYFDRYCTYFKRVECIDSSHAPERYQTYVYEDRNRWPDLKCPLRPAMSGERHLDFMPICYV